MPNAQTHLSAACKLLDDPRTRASLPWLAQDDARAAFLLGTISPDVRAISGHSREDTHFFAIPLIDPRPAQTAMFAAHPRIGQGAALRPAHAAFIAGYVTHLIMDQTWVEMIVMPGLFIQGASWGIEHPNWRLYSILMTYLEYRAQAELPPDALTHMITASPDEWLPFVEDRYLAEWRDRIAKYIHKGGAKLVSSVLAKTSGMTPDEMEEIVLSEERMSSQAYPVVPRQWLLDFEQETARRCQQAVTGYLAG